MMGVEEPVNGLNTRKDMVHCEEPAKNLLKMWFEAQASKRGEKWWGWSSVDLNQLVSAWRWERELSMRGPEFGPDRMKTSSTSTMSNLK
jgi:hypothetical protein